ncbi:Protein of unknown function DUF4385 [Ceraceosorus bombacis]|uniref:Uncharacterized protein n=1 Tax=Ceraceosorus bombacis TaxID=401625 RepID=A0A0P1BJH5_9BASI|nr:Protein of unknown function DUF4385 [Ceraceosorus bombacis]
MPAQSRRSTRLQTAAPTTVQEASASKIPTASDSSATTTSKAKATSFPLSRLPDLPWSRIDVRKNPWLYRPARGEQGVLQIEPYKSELLPLWAFKDEETAKRSSKDLLDMFEKYKGEDDFVGCDMARKYIQMGLTRARRYANHAGGKKYSPSGSELSRSNAEDPVKAASALIFQKVLEERIKPDRKYAALRAAFARRYDGGEIPEPGELTRDGIVRPPTNAEVEKEGAQKRKREDDEQKRELRRQVRQQERQAGRSAVS